MGRYVTRSASSSRRWSPPGYYKLKPIYQPIKFVHFSFFVLLTNQLFPTVTNDDVRAPRSSFLVASLLHSVRPAR